MPAHQNSQVPNNQLEHGGVQSLFFVNVRPRSNTNNRYISDLILTGTIKHDPTFGFSMRASKQRDII